MERQIINVDVKHILDTLDFSNDQLRDIIMVPSLGSGGVGRISCFAAVSVSRVFILTPRAWT